MNHMDGSVACLVNPPPPEFGCFDKDAVWRWTILHSVEPTTCPPHMHISVPPTSLFLIR